LTSFPTGTTLYDHFTLIMRLDDYPDSTPAIFKINLVYRECFPYNFKSPKIEDIKMKVGDMGPEIDYSYDQFPCVWNQTYTVNFITPSGDTTTLPTFITRKGTPFIISVPENKDVGQYKFKICSQIDNSLNT